MAIATGGTYVFLTDHSGVGNSHIEPTIGSYQVEHLNDLLVQIASRYIRTPAAS
jgi:methylmalonyl-CoA mutase N-terminal domain/subunit